MAEILHQETRKVLFQDDERLLKQTLVNAVEANSDLRGADLSNADLSGVVLNGVDLSYANLSYSMLNSIDNGAYPVGIYGDMAHDYELTDLSECNLTGAQLIETNLNEARLFRVNFRNAILTRTNLFGANLCEAIFVETKFTNVEFGNTRLGKTIFGLTNLSSCLSLEVTYFSGKCVIDNETLRNSGTIKREFLDKMGLSEDYVDYAISLTNDKPIKMFPVFLSHSSKDKMFVRKLYNELRENGVHCFLDEREIKIGDKLITEISRGVEVYDKMLLICSRESLTSWWVEREIERILEKERRYNQGRKNKVNLLIPITVDNYIFNGFEGDWSTEIKRYKIGDFRQWMDKQSFSKTFDALVQSLQAEPNVFIPPSYLSAE